MACLISQVQRVQVKIRPFLYQEWNNLHRKKCVKCFIIWYWKLFFFTWSDSNKDRKYMCLKLPKWQYMFWISLENKREMTASRLFYLEYIIFLTHYIVFLFLKNQTFDPLTDYCSKRYYHPDECIKVRTRAPPIQQWKTCLPVRTEVSCLHLPHCYCRGWFSVQVDVIISFNE